MFSYSYGFSVTPRFYSVSGLHFDKQILKNLELFNNINNKKYYLYFFVNKIIKCLFLNLLITFFLQKKARLNSLAFYLILN